MGNVERYLDASDGRILIEDDGVGDSVGSIVRNVLVGRRVALDRLRILNWHFVEAHRGARIRDLTDDQIGGRSIPPITVRNR